MKTMFRNLLCVLPLFLLTACGSGQQTSTSLEVSRSFAVTNPSYGGGLSISGKNITTGQSFSVSLIGQTSVQYSLDAGDWIFTAVGWDGGGTPGTEKIFAGKPFCGLVQQELSGSTASVTLNLSEATCATQAFAGNLPSGAAGKYARKLKAIVSCNTFFNGPIAATDIVSTKIVNAATSLTFCEALSDDLQSDIESIKIHALNKGPYETVANPGITSECMSNDSTNLSVINTDSATSPTNPYGTGYDLRLPLRGVPFIIMAYRDGACTEPLARYVFRQGLLPIHPGFDHLLLDNNGANDEVKLILPGSDMKRALSPLAHLVPFFKKAGGTRFPTEALVAEEFHAFASTTNKMVVERASCGTFGTHSNVSVSPAPTCIDLGEHIEITYQPATAPSTGYISMDLDTYYFYAETAAGAPRFASNKILWNLLGPTDPTMGRENFYGEPNKNHDTDYGALSVIRNMFSANGAGGLMFGFDHSLTFENACLNQITERSITIFNYEKMVDESYKVKLHNTKVSTPSPYLRDLVSRDSSVVVEDYDKRMLIWDYQRDLVNPVMVLEFSCSELLGTLESYMVHPHPNGTEHERTITSWNTNTSGTGLENQRFEVLKHNVTKDSVGTVVRDIRSVSRTDKLPGGNDYANWHYLFKSTFDGTDYDEIIEYYDQISETNNVCYMRDLQSVLSYSYLGEIFADPNSTIVALRNRAPGSGTSAYYTIDGTFPQTINLTACASPIPLFTTTNGGHWINGNSSLPIMLDSLGPSFTSEFGGTFFTAP